MSNMVINIQTVLKRASILKMGSPHKSSLEGLKKVKQTREKSNWTAIRDKENKGEDS